MEQYLVSPLSQESKIIHLLQQWATTKVVLGLFTLTMVVFLTMLFYSIPAVEHFAAGKELFDLSPAGYSYDDAIALLETLGVAGRSVYLNLQLPLDFIYPGLFAITYTLLLVWTFNKAFVADSRMFYFSVVPVLAGVFDYLENICIFNMLHDYPHISHGLVYTASNFTILKSAFSTLFFILFFAGLYSAVKNKKTQH